MNQEMSSSLNYYIRVRIGEAKSKEEEDVEIVKDLIEVKKDIAKPNLNEQQIWEVMLRIIYADMLGHDTDFAHSFIVNNVQNKQYKVKRISYLAANLLLDQDTPFRIMLVASLQKDLNNGCLYNQIIALNAVTKMMCPLNASAFIEPIQKLLTSNQGVLRKKSAIAAIKLEEMLPGSLPSFDSIMEKCLRDKDASVMMVALPYYR